MFRVISKIFESVYNEFGKLDSLEEKLSPKLKALLAAGLIGTASLGMQSCAQPTGDDPYYGDGTNTEVTAPAPTDNTTNDSADNTKKGGENTVETEEQKWAKTPFGQLGVSKEHAEKLATTAKVIDEKEGLVIGTIKGSIAPNYKYTGNINDGGFMKVTSEESGIYKIYIPLDLSCIYHIPTDKAGSFDEAIKTYKSN